jgi:oligopeptide/dipeptide ABC transporter ATP-binding protein
MLLIQKDKMENILEIKNLSTVFKTPRGVVEAVRNLSLNIQKKSIHAIVGESGSGKSVSALSILNLIDCPPGEIINGEIIFNSDQSRKDLLKLSEKELRKIRGREISMIFQEPMTSLNPVYTIGDQIMEAIIEHADISKKEAKDKTIEMLKTVSISNPESRFNDYPHQLSGGMLQRVMIAMALIFKPKLLIADEPTTALDVTVQRQILELMKNLVDQFDMTLLLITHDFGLVAEYADYVSVMYAGEIIEEASTIDIFDHPAHPYTRGLLKSVPSYGKNKSENLYAISGSVPDLTNLPKGCAYYDRCERREDQCLKEKPELESIKENHLKRCFFPYEDKEK